MKQTAIPTLFDFATKTKRDTPKFRKKVHIIHFKNSHSVIKYYNNNFLRSQFRPLRDPLDSEGTESEAENNGYVVFSMKDLRLGKFDPNDDGNNNDDCCECTESCKHARVRHQCDELRKANEELNKKLKSVTWEFKTAQRALNVLKEKLATCFSEEQIEALGKERFQWSDDAIKDGLKFRSFLGPDSYDYLRSEMHYPIPSSNTLNRRLRMQQKANDEVQGMPIVRVIESLDGQAVQVADEEISEEAEQNVGYYTITEGAEEGLAGDFEDNSEEQQQEYFEEEQEVSNDDPEIIELDNCYQIESGNFISIDMDSSQEHTMEDDDFLEDDQSSIETVDDKDS